MSHELCSVFAAVSLPLAPKLVEMLDEHFSHQTERRGCGFTQATRFLAVLINQSRSATGKQDFGVFERATARRVERLAKAAQLAGWKHGWRRLDLAPAEIMARLPPSQAMDDLCRLDARLTEIANQLRWPESLLLHGLIRDLLDRHDNDETCDVLPAMPEKPDIGSCTAAEEYFLEIAHGRLRRGGEVNIVVSADGRPLLVEKMFLGESHSAMSLVPIVIHSVRLPAGSLFALKREDDPVGARALPCGYALPSSCIEQTRFLRFTTLVVAPEDRARAFGRQLEMQLRGNMFSPKTTSLAHMREFVIGMLDA